MTSTSSGKRKWGRQMVACAQIPLHFLPKPKHIFQDLCSSFAALAVTADASNKARTGKDVACKPVLQVKPFVKHIFPIHRRRKLLMALRAMGFYPSTPRRAWKTECSEGIWHNVWCKLHIGPPHLLCFTACLRRSPRTWTMTSTSSGKRQGVNKWLSRVFQDLCNSFAASKKARTGEDLACKPVLQVKPFSQTHLRYPRAQEIADASRSTRVLTQHAKASVGRAS